MLLNNRASERSQIPNAIVWKDNRIEGMNYELGKIESEVLHMQSEWSERERCWHDDNVLSGHQTELFENIHWVKSPFNAGLKAKKSSISPISLGIRHTHLTWLLIDVPNMNPKREETNWNIFHSKPSKKVRHCKTNSCTCWCFVGTKNYKFFFWKWPTNSKQWGLNSAFSIFIKITNDCKWIIKEEQTKKLFRPMLDISFLHVQANCWGISFRFPFQFLIA